MALIWKFEKWHQFTNLKKKAPIFKIQTKKRRQIWNFEKWRELWKLKIARILKILMKRRQYSNWNKKAPILKTQTKNGANF